MLEASKAQEKIGSLQAAPGSDLVAKALLGLALLKSDPAEGQRLLNEVADKGDAAASMWALASDEVLDSVYNGTQGGRTRMEAMALRAANNGHPDGMAALGLMLSVSDVSTKREEGRKWLASSADAGSRLGMALHGRFLANTSDAPEALREARELFLRAASYGSDMALIDLATTHLYGVNTPRNDEVAIACARAAASFERSERTNRNDYLLAHQIIADIRQRRPDLAGSDEEAEGLAGLRAIARRERERLLATVPGAPKQEDLDRWGLSYADWFDFNTETLYAKSQAGERRAMVIANKDNDPVSAYLNAAHFIVGLGQIEPGIPTGVRLLRKLAGQGNLAAAYHLYALHHGEPGAWLTVEEGQKWQELLRSRSDPRILEMELMRKIRARAEIDPSVQIFRSDLAKEALATSAYGSMIAMWLSAEAYFDGSAGVTRDQNQGVLLLLAAADAGHGPAMVGLAKLHAEGRCVIKSPALAAYWSKQALAASGMTPQSVERARGLLNQAEAELALSGKG